MFIKITCLAPSDIDSTSSPCSSGKGLNKNNIYKRKQVCDISMYVNSKIFLRDFMFVYFKSLSHRSQNFCVLNLGIKHLSKSYADLRINLILLWYPVIVIPWRDNFNWGIKHLKVTLFDIEILHSTFTISTLKFRSLMFKSKKKKIKLKWANVQPLMSDFMWCKSWDQKLISNLCRT